jgi:hypothetical protein
MLKTQYPTTMNSNPALGLIGFWMMLQLAATIAILLGGIYALYCLGRASAGLDRMASAMEEWVEQQRAGSTPPLPGRPNITPASTRSEQPPISPIANLTTASIPVITSPPSAAPQGGPEQSSQTVI